MGCAINIDYVADFNFLLCRKNDLHVAVNDDRSIYFAGCVFRFNADRSELNIIRFMLDSTDFATPSTVLVTVKVPATSDVSLTVAPPAEPV